MKLLFIKDLDLRNSPVVRASINHAAVEEYAAAYKAKEKLPPIEVFKPKGGNLFIVADGMHRISACVAANIKVIQANVREGGYDDALRFALTCNSSHGLRRTNEDKRRCVQLALGKWSDSTDNAIAKMCLVNNHLVAEIRKELEGKLKIKPAPVRKTADGKSFPSEPKPAPAQPRLENSNLPAVKSAKPAVVDAIGYPIPEEILPLWERRNNIEATLDCLSGIRRELQKATEDKDPLFNEVVMSAAQADLTNLMKNLANARPFAVCPNCQGRMMNKKCSLCGNSGFISKFRWDRTVPEEEKEIRLKGIKNAK